jgi:hypothetical protein
VTRDERLDLIDRLRRANIDSTVEIERRAAAREADPYSEIERLMADARFTKDDSDFVYTEPASGRGSPPVEKSGSDVLMYRTHYENSQTLVPGHDADPSGDDEVWAALEKFTRATAKALGDDAASLAELRRKLAGVDRHIANLESENRELKGLLASTLKQLDKLESNGTGYMVRLSRLEGLMHGKLDHLAKLADAAGLLPRGWS